MQDRERVLSALSHDMKNLVGAVDMNLQLIPLILQTSQVPANGEAPVGEFLERAHQAALGIGSLVDDVVAWFRMSDNPEAALIVDPEDAMNLGRLSALARAEFSSPVKTQGVVFHLQMDGESSAVLPGNGAPWRVLRLVFQHCLRFLFPNQLLSVKIWALDGGPFEVAITTDQEAVFDGQARSLALILAQDFASASGATSVVTTGAAGGSGAGEMITFRWV